MKELYVYTFKKKPEAKDMHERINPENKYMICTWGELKGKQAGFVKKHRVYFLEVTQEIGT